MAPLLELSLPLNMKLPGVPILLTQYLNHMQAKAVHSDNEISRIIL